ncbi:TetR/AcrR family transcriptional regulator [Actinomadura meridiana]|uniref:TetR/AcrR family transcriptional regulator n=1 Tax=Actinomadura meridiana TaxID=559626 RepID=A0ABP8BUG4_9ACTN
MTNGDGSGLRARTRRAVRAELAATAIGLFVERGFDDTTVDDIAAAAGVSRRSFFRYFPSKEDAVFGDAEDVAGRVADAVTARPAGEPPWECLRAVLHDWREPIRAAHPDPALLRLIETTPALRARLHVKREQMRERIAAALLARGGLDAFTADLLTGAAGAALDAANRAWLRSDGALDHAELLDRAFTALRPQS